MQGLFESVNEAAEAVRSAGVEPPRAGIILGSGLGGLADQITERRVAIPYEAIPHFPQSTAAGHAGQLIGGRLGGVPVVALQGRFHLYEGWAARQAALPVWMMQALGVDTLVVSNAAGGVNPHYRVGDLMLIEDQVNLMAANPLIGVNDERLGDRFPDMSEPYDQQLLRYAEQTAIEHGFSCRTGTYVGMLGPTYETRAEYRMVRHLGGDAVGMSTVPEVIAARHAGLRVLGLSVITNACSPDALGETDHQEVVAAASAAGKRMQTIVEAVVRQLPAASCST